MNNQSHPITMKKIFSFLAALCLASVSWGQTGTGIVLLTEASHDFGGTTVDSTTTLNLQLQNTVGTAQTVSLAGLSAPFSTSLGASVEVDAEEIVDFSISFNPSQLGEFSDTLDVEGNIFGEASLVLSGTGIQVQLDWSPGELVFDTTAIGQTNQQALTLSSVGDGDAVISAIEFSNDLFSLDSTSSSFSIAEGTSGNIVVNYAPVNAGAVDATMTLHTNDPTNATIEIALTAVGISEVSGDICDITWTIANSPYTLVGDVVVPEGCTLNIDPGVEVIGNDYTLKVFGAFFTHGTAGNEVSIHVGEMLSYAEKESIILSHTVLRETKDSNVLTYNLASPHNLFSNENYLNHYGKFYENFSDNLGQGWTATGVDSQSSNGQLYAYYDGASSGSWYTTWMYSPTFSFNPNEIPTSLGLSTRMSQYSEGNSEMRYYVSYDNNEWVELAYRGAPQSGQWYEDYFSLSPPAGCESMQFRVRFHYRYYSSCYLDDFELVSNFYPGSDIPFTEVVYPDYNISTGGLKLLDSEYYGNLIFAGDTTDIEVAGSSIFKNSERDIYSNGLSLFGAINNLELNESSVMDFDLSGVCLGGTSQVQSSSTIITNNSKIGLQASGTTNWTSTHDEFALNGTAIELESITGSMLYAQIKNNLGNAISVDGISSLDLKYVLIDNNEGTGIHLGPLSQLQISNSRVKNSGGNGIYSESPVFMNHCNIAYNENTGVNLNGNNFHTLNNSILWGNNSSNYTQIDIGGGVISTSYSTVQGRSSYGIAGDGQFYWGEGVIEADPLFSDDNLHLEFFSPCVDGGQPWHQDAYMPFGLGGVRADMGMYGGPDNAFWGGEALPDGASALTGVSDSPQDQGGVVGLVFDASFYDNSDLVNNVTSYAFWRHYDPTGQSIGTLDEGNWELIGEMPAQSFNGYAYQAQTLGNTNSFGTFNSCYTVVAQTDDPDTYWYSNVMCGESVDNLAPVEPELGGMVLETGGVTVFWDTPQEADYAYTEITSDAGFMAEVNSDTLAVDLSAELVGTYTYTAVHYDVNGNGSEPSSVTLEVEAGIDVIELNAGWNLISTDRAIDQNVGEVFAGLAEGNLQYVTGFEGGVQFYDPSGLSFLNTLSTLTPGHGYWVKVDADDVLEVSGTRLDEAYMPGLLEGWNLVGFAAEDPAAPGNVFADLEAEGDLLYVTGFDQGVQVYDPNGLSFLNTLTEMRNGFGYWVKSAVATEGDVLAPLSGDVLPAAKPSPRYDVVNGTSTLGDHAGEFVDVLNGWGTVVARLPIVEGGHLMTTALFGDDPATGVVEGLAEGEVLHFAFRGSMANETLVFGGDMAHKTLALTFDELDAGLSVFPNPATDVTTVRVHAIEAGSATLEVTDVQGRVVLRQGLSLAAGVQAVMLDVEALEGGAYSVELRQGTTPLGTSRLVVLD